MTYDDLVFCFILSAGLMNHFIREENKRGQLKIQASKHKDAFRMGTGLATEAELKSNSKLMHCI